MPRALALGATLLALGGGCGGGGETVEEASQAVARVMSSDDCLKLQDVAASVPLALGGAVSTATAGHAEFLAEFAGRAPRELAADVAVVQRALAAVAHGLEVAAADQAEVRASAAELGAWARSSCPG